MIPQNPFDKSEAFLQISPLGRIPALEDESGRCLADSSVISEYLEERFPTPPLFPKDPYRRACVRWFDEYADGGMAPSLTGKVFFQRVISPKLMNTPPDEKVVAAGLADTPKYFGYLEKQLGNNQYLVDNTFTLADISVATQIVNLRHAQVEVEREKFPSLAGWFERVAGRPTFAPLVEQDQGFLARLAS